MEAAIAQSREYGRVVSIGHSLGGRLSLISSADFAVGISPPLDKKYSDSTLAKLEKLRSYRVRPNDPRVVFDALERMPMWNPSTKDALIIYGSRDVPEIVASCNILCDSGENVIKIEQGLHSDTYLLDSTYMAVVRQLAEWFHND